MLNICVDCSLSAGTIALGKNTYIFSDVTTLGQGALIVQPYSPSSFRINRAQLAIPQR